MIQNLLPEGFFDINKYSNSTFLWLNVISSMASIIASDVDLFGLKPYWLSASNWCTMNVSSLLLKSCSGILENCGNKEPVVGKMMLVPVLYGEMTLAIFILLGNDPFWNDKLQMHANSFWDPFYDLFHYCHIYVIISWLFVLTFFNNVQYFFLIHRS